MSYTEYDAWIDEKANGNWPFDRWDVGSFPLREGFSYFLHPTGISGVGLLHYRLCTSFDYQRRTNQELNSRLDAVKEVIRCAIENSEGDAYSAWLRHEIWLPVLDDSIYGSEQPADMLAQSIDYVGVQDEYSEQELCAALGIWLLGELNVLRTPEDFRHVSTIVQIGVAAAEAEYYRGLSEGRNKEIIKVAKRTKIANDQRHAANRQRTLEAEKWWIAVGFGKMSAAEAARKISEKYHVVEAVAQRWIREFRRRAEK